MHTGLFIPRFNTFRSLPKLLLGLFLLCGALFLGSVPEGAAAAQQGGEVSLKLDRDMVPILGTQALNPDALTASRHASELQSRLLKLRDQLTTLDQANVEGARQLSERQQFVDEIRALVSKQGKLVASLREEIRRPAARVSAAPVAMPQATPSPAPAAANSGPPIRLGPIELPAGFENWLLEGVLGVVIVLLLVMTLHFRSYAKTKDAELVELADFAMRERGAPAVAQVGAPAGDEDRTEPKARIEGVSADARPAVKAPPSKPAAAPPPPKLEAAPPPKLEAAPPPKPEAAPPPKPEAAPPPKPEAAPPLKLEAVPVASKDDAASADSAMEEMEKTLDDAAIGDEAGAPTADATGSDQETIDWTKTMLGRKAESPNVLREIDTLIAFEDYEKAKLLLEEILKGNPTNPEYRLRMLHLEATSGDKHKAELEEQILAKMMEGPLSDTIRRVKEIGRGLMPGHPLFDDAATLDEATRLLDEFDREEQQGAADPSQDGSVDSSTDDFFNLISEEDELITEEGEAPPGRSDGGEDSEMLDEAMRLLDEVDGEEQQGAADPSQDGSVDSDAIDFFNLISEEDELISEEGEAPPGRSDGGEGAKTLAEDEDRAETKARSADRDAATQAAAASSTPLKLEAVPVASKEDAASADSAMEEIEKTADFAAIGDEAGAPSADATGSDQDTIDWTKTMLGPKAESPNAFKDVDTIIDKFDTYAKRLLDKFDKEQQPGVAPPSQDGSVDSDTGDFFNLISEEDEPISEEGEAPPGRSDGGGDAETLAEDEDRAETKARSADRGAATQAAAASSTPLTLEAAPPKPEAPPLTLEAAPPKPEAAPPKPEAAPPKLEATPPPKPEAAPVASKEDAVSADSTMEKMEKTVFFSANRDEAGSPAADATGSYQETIDWKKAMRDRKAADPDALRHVDTLIAFEQYEKAKLLLQEAMKSNLTNPEYRLRMLHLEAASGDKRKAELEERILAEMMEGPLSDTIRRVKEIGRGLMPGHPLFDDAETLDEATRLLDEFDREEQQGAADPSQDGSVDSDSVDFLNLISEEDEPISEEGEAPPGRSDGGEGDGSKKP